MVLADGVRQSVRQWVRQWDLARALCQSNQKSLAAKAGFIGGYHLAADIMKPSKIGHCAQPINWHSFSAC